MLLSLPPFEQFLFFSTTVYSREGKGEGGREERAIKCCPVVSILPSNSELQRRTTQTFLSTRANLEKAWENVMTFSQFFKS